MIGKYLVDTVSETIETFVRKDDYLLNTEFTYERMVDFLKGRQIDFGRPPACLAAYAVVQRQADLCHLLPG